MTLFKNSLLLIFLSFICIIALPCSAYATEDFDIVVRSNSDGPTGEDGPCSRTLDITLNNATTRMTISAITITATVSSGLSNVTTQQIVVSNPGTFFSTLGGGYLSTSASNYVTFSDLFVGHGSNCIITYTFEVQTSQGVVTETIVTSEKNIPPGCLVGGDW